MPTVWNIGCRDDPSLDCEVGHRMEHQKSGVLRAFLIVSSQEQVADSAGKGCANRRIAKCP